jgi:hypothetical protein
MEEEGFNENQMPGFEAMEKITLKEQIAEADKYLEEERKEMAKYYAAEAARDAEWTRSNQRIFRAIERQLGKYYLKDIMECLDESEAYDKFQLVRNPDVKKQEEEWGSFDHILVDQYCNGGYAGDDFAGYIYIPLKEGLYLKSHYSM